MKDKLIRVELDTGITITISRTFAVCFECFSSVFWPELCLV